MVRISDILKKKMQEGIPQKGVIKEAPKEQDLKALLQEKDPQKMKIAQVMKEIQPDMQKSKELYSKALELIKELLKNSREDKPIELTGLKEVVKEVVDTFVLGDNTLLTLAANDYTGDEYPYNHMVNVMMMSIKLGLELEYNKSRLNELGLAAILHDIGMNDFIEMVIEPRALSEEEYSLVKQHPENGAKKLSSLKDVSEAMVTAIREHHERFKGNGYPNDITNGNISEYGRLIATLDVYEALTHSRNYRQKKYSPHEAIKELFTNSSSFFDPGILKVFINQIGIYPTGSWLELNTNEIARVITPNVNFPIRPVINVLFSANKKRLEEPRLINLAKQFNIYIKRPLSDEEVLEIIKE